MRKKREKIRLDQHLVTSLAIESLAKAQAMIMAGEVQVNSQRIDKSSFLLDPNLDQVQTRHSTPYVSRGGLKLEGALQQLHLANKLNGLTAMDIGSSTGGFTDCLLQYGVKKVFAIDVGYNLLDWQLRKDPRVVLHERCHIKDFVSPKIAIDFIVADISFNSLSQLAHFIFRPEWIQAYFLLLVKPQFELPKSLIPKGGIITSPEHFLFSKQSVTQTIESYGISGRFIDSSLKGRKGNQEFFFYSEKK